MRAFFRFWYDFIVGDDWMIAVGVTVALAVTALAAHNRVTAWWILPIVVAAGLSWSVLRATRAKRG